MQESPDSLHHNYKTLVVADVVLGDLLKRLALGLRHEQRHEHATEVGAGEQEERVADTDPGRVPVVWLLGILRRAERADDGAGRGTWNGASPGRSHKSI
jgi:hypothetical protein